MIAGLLAAGLVLGPTVAFTVGDPRITEASGLAPGLRSPGVVYVQNDSGDTNRFFALDARSGATVATVTVAGAVNVDWEDLAVARDARGRSSVWLADTGNNTSERDVVQLYRVDEPRLDPSARGERITTGRADVWRLRFPGPPVDTESLAVAPGGAAYLVTKSFTGSSVVYRVPPTPDRSRVQTLTEVGRIDFTLTGTPGGPNPIGQVTATGAAFSRDGRVLAVRTYTDAYLWPVRDGDVAAALTRRPTRVALPAQPQGEGIAVSGDRLLVDSEGTDQPVYAVDLPGLPETVEPSITQTRISGVPATTAAEPDDGDRSGSDAARYVVGGAVVIAGALLVLFLGRRRH